ncbi:MAG: hypothetical protein KY429_09855 [Actinobacteria bacterium]|nr:hypothetical protein [Actinomycetota bacterium]
MTDLEQRMKELDNLQPPDLWQSIKVRSGRPQTFIQRILNYFRLVSAMQVAAFALALAAIIGAGVVVTTLRVQEVSTATDPGETANEDENIDESKGDQTKSEGSVVSGGPAGSSGGPRATRGSSSAKGVQSAGSHPASGDPPGFETAGPPVFYTDQADDAYGPDSPPNAALSQTEFDILRVDWGPVPYVSEESPGGYSTSITIAGAARADAWYISFGHFRSCDLYHILAPGITAFSNAVCLDSDDSPQSRIVQGSPVTSTPTADGGTVLSATFDNRAIPPSLQTAGRTLHNLSAMTCMHRTNDGSLDCASQIDVMDIARSNETYRV